MANAFQRPEERQSTLDKIALGLQAFGAGVQGRGPEFLALQEQQRQQLSQERQRAAAQDLLRSKALLDAGNVGGFMQLANERIGFIQQLGGDPSDTMRLAQLGQLSLEGDRNAFAQLQTEINAGLQAASGAGLIEGGEELELRRAAQRTREEELEFRREEAERAASEFATREEREQAELELERQREQRQERRLSAESEKALLDSQDAIQGLSADANKFDNLAADFIRLTPEAGVTARLDEFLKQTLGTEDDVTEIRRRFAGIRSSQAVRNLPPGVASDKDIELALSGFPTTTTNPNEIVSFLRGAAKMARVDAAFNQFRADFISRRGSPRNLNSSWRRKVESSALGREVSVGEIYIAAMNKGVSPEEAMQELGIQGLEF